jgi:hypothetical protein
MNIIKTSDALRVWLDKHKVRFGTTERINGELPLYAQLPDAKPDDAVTVVVLIPNREGFLDSEIVPFSTHKRSDFPDRPKAQFKEEDTAISAAGYLTGKEKLVLAPKILDPSQIDGPQPNTEATKTAAEIAVHDSVLERAIRKATQVTNDDEASALLNTIYRMTEDEETMPLGKVLHTILKEYEALPKPNMADYRAMSPNGNGIVG